MGVSLYNLVALSVDTEVNSHHHPSTVHVQSVNFFSCSQHSGDSFSAQPVTKHLENGWLGKLSKTTKCIRVKLKALTKTIVIVELSSSYIILSSLINGMRKVTDMKSINVISV